MNTCQCTCCKSWAETLSAEKQRGLRAVEEARAEAFELVEFIYRGTTCPMRLVEVYDRLRDAARAAGKGK